MAGVVIAKLELSGDTVREARRVRKWLKEQGHARPGGPGMTVLLGTSRPTVPPVIDPIAAATPSGQKRRATGVRAPEVIERLLASALDGLARGHALELVRVDEELTTQQVAELLRISRPFVTRLLIRGEIPHHMVGTHRRVYRTDAEAYRDRRDRRSRRALRERLRRLRWVRNRADRGS